MENGGCDHICVSRSEGVECQCRDGYDLIGTSTCSGTFVCLFVYLWLVKQ